MAKRKAYISTMYNFVYQFPHLIIMNRLNEDNSLPLTGFDPTYGMQPAYPNWKTGWPLINGFSMFAFYPDHTTRLNDTNCFSPRLKNRVCGIHMSFWCGLLTKENQKPELFFLTRFWIGSMTMSWFGIVAFVPRHNNLN